jgi:hypothetical protein
MRGRKRVGVDAEAEPVLDGTEASEEEIEEMTEDETDESEEENEVEEVVEVEEIEELSEEDAELRSASGNLSHSLGWLPQR